VRTSNGQISITTSGGGSLVRTGSINAGTANVALALAGGTNGTGLITAGTLNVTANSTSSLNTAIGTLNANITGAGQSLTVNESNGLSIGANGIVTNSGAVTIASTLGGINGTGQIRAGSGNVSLNTPNGSITLGSSANQIVGNVLTLTALNSSVVNTSINALDASITGTGSLTVNEANNLTVLQARTANGAINLTTSTNSIVNITSISAATGLNGNLTVVNGNLYIDAPGILATQTVDLQRAQSVWLLSGNIHANLILLPTGNATLNYLVTSPDDSGTGTVRDIITRINAAAGDYNSTIQVLSTTSVALVSALPVMQKQMNVNGRNLLTLDGSSTGTTTSGFTITSTKTARSTISGVTFTKFGGAGVDFVGAQNISVTGVSVTDSGIGFRASGILTGSGVFGSTFTNNVIGGMMSQAQSLSVGFNPVGGALLGNTFTGGTGFRGASTTGISVSGTSTGTVVKANTFTGYPTAISLVAATGVTVGGLNAGEGNAISNAVTAGIYASGFCTGSFVYKTTFPSGVLATKQYLVSTSRNLTIVK